MLFRSLSALTVVLLLAVYWGCATARLAPASAWLCALLAFVCTGKVFSPQYVVWFLPFVVLRDSRWTGQNAGIAQAQWLWLMSCGLTTIAYPMTFGDYLFPALQRGVLPAWWMVMVAVRNGLLIAAAAQAIGAFPASLRRPRSPATN